MRPGKLNSQISISKLLYFQSQTLPDQGIDKNYIHARRCLGGRKLGTDLDCHVVVDS